MTRKKERVAKNGRLTVSLPVDVVESLNKIGEELEAETGLGLSYAQIVVALVHKYNKQDDK
jgi:hypothetical protein